MTSKEAPKIFFGWRVTQAAFVVAVCGLGMGFHGPGIYLYAVQDARGWPLSLISMAVTTHFLLGAVVTANLPRLYAKFGLPAVTKFGVISLAVGVFGWAVAAEPWQLFVATIFSGAGWVTMGVAAINSMVSPWFDQDRPKALAIAYNGANIGGVIFGPLWIFAISNFGFPIAALVIGLGVVGLVWVVSDRFLAKSPDAARQASARCGTSIGCPVSGRGD